MNQVMDQDIMEKSYLADIYNVTNKLIKLNIYIFIYI